MDIQQTIESQEKATLSPYATLSINSKGRQREEKPSPLRTCFQRDRDRIIHCKAFRRLSHKTQVFLSPEGDHYRTRLTHTLEVSQISRTIARALKLNEDLTEAIALGHDLGHTPFGHIGEDALTEVLQGKGFLKSGQRWRHNEQSIRVVELIEYDGKGLNLTFEVRDGILNHPSEGKPATLEGQIVRITDRVAYVNHDIDDAIRGGIITNDDIPAQSLAILGQYHGIRIDNMVNDIIKNSQDKDKIVMSEEVGQAMDDLRNFLFETVYLDSAAKTEDNKAIAVLKQLFLYYLDRPGELPEEFRSNDSSELSKGICDYIAGMTDRFAIRKYQELFVPKSWMV